MTSSTTSSTKPRPASPTLATLAEELQRLEGRFRPRGDVISSGHPALDRFLPAGGFRRGSLVEWLPGRRGSGAATLALLAARQAALDGGALVIVDSPPRFYPPAALRWGLALQQLVIVRPTGEADYAWALDQILRSRGVAAVWCWPPEQDEHTQRRWQLAAEASGVLGLLLRSPRARHAPSWAELRLLVEPVVDRRSAAASRQRRLRIELVRSRLGRAEGTVELEIAHGGLPLIPGSSPSTREDRQEPSHVVAEARAMYLASRVAAAKTGRRSRRA